MKKIIIEKVEVRTSSKMNNGGGVSVLAAKISGEKSGELFFAVDEKFGKYFSEDRADCFVAALLPQAAMDGCDIESLVPVSDDLLFTLNTFLCEILGGVYEQRKICVRAPQISVPVVSSGAVGTGLTCGVDSLYTVAEYSQTEFHRQNLTHLCLFNVGSHHIGAEKPEEMARFRIELAKRFCEENGYEFLYVDSNVHEFSPNYTRYYSVLNVAAAMSLPKLFSSYYSSSGYAVSEFHATAVDLAHFESFVLEMLSTASLRFFSTGSEVSRLDKVKRLVSFRPSFGFLNVCNTYTKNCGHCIKCLRTLYALDIFDSLDKYSKVFDLDDYRRNHRKRIAECWVRKVFAKDGYCREMWPKLRKKYGVPVFDIARESVRFVLSRLRIYSFSYIRYRLRDAK